jgi:predicted alternative tryptophan synthase beta-subunit
MIVFPKFNRHQILLRIGQMPLSPRQYNQKKGSCEKPAGHSGSGISMATALMVESMVYMVHNSQALQKGER